MKQYLNLAQILLSIALIIAILLQSRGAGFGGAFGTQSTVFRTRRGLERTLFQITIILAVVFTLISIISARVS